MASSCAQPRRTAPNTTRSRSAAPARPAGPPSTTSATGIGPREKLTIEGLFEAAVPGPDRVHQMHRDQRFGRGTCGHLRGVAPARCRTISSSTDEWILTRSQLSANHSGLVRLADRFAWRLPATFLVAIEPMFDGPRSGARRYAQGAFNSCPQVIQVSALS